MLQLSTVHKIFTENTPPILGDDIPKINQDLRWIGLIQQASKLKLAPFPDTKTNLKLLLKGQTDPKTRAIIYIGISRYYKGVGNLTKTAQALAHAHSLIRDTDPSDAHAFLSIEMAILLSITGNIEYGQTLLEKTVQLTDSESLLKLALFRLLENRMRLGEKNIIQPLNDSLAYFQSQNESIAQANHFKAIGNAYRRLNDYQLAMESYLDGIKIAVTNGHAHIATSIEHDIGMLYFHMGQPEKAIKQLQEVETDSLNYYVQCVSLSNIGFIELSMGDNKRAIQSFTKALSIATQHGIYHRMTGLNYYLGTLYEKDVKLDLSRNYYLAGFESAMNMVEKHFPCTGDTLKAIKGYHAFTEQYGQYSQMAGKEKIDEWNFLASKPLSESKSIFQNRLLNRMIDFYGSKRKAAKQLKMSERSIFDVLNKLKMQDHSDSFNIIDDLIQVHHPLSWTKINSLFENKIIQRAYQNNDKNIRQSAKSLNISYAGAANKLKEIKKSTNLDIIK
ncbi:MAG: hypothetical protein ISR83_04435 [Candidatus Marinimicrobia bacterium]|nr:hypothetical protein [Candidatus Neomarinimicrobiota bacterium]